MDESKILSPEEVDALLKAAQEKENDLSKLLNSFSKVEDSETATNYKALANIVELTWSECEKTFSSFLRRKVTVSHKDAKFAKLSDSLAGKNEKHVFSIFYIAATNDFCMVILTLPLLHQMINALFGGSINSKEPIIESPGKIGLIIAEKMAALALDSFSLACKEYGTIEFEVSKTVTLPNLISKLSMEDDIYALTYNTKIGETESELTFILPVHFLHKFLPKNDISSEEQIKKNRAWRIAIENQVIDSDITLIASLPGINMKAKDLLALKSGDIIQISDPTIVDVHLNDVKLFYANAAQANEKRIIKILAES